LFGPHNAIERSERQTRSSIYGPDDGNRIHSTDGICLWSSSSWDFAGRSFKKPSD